MTQAARVAITAGGSGIGAVIAERFVSQGARVHVCDMSAASLQDLAQRLPDITTSVVDVSSEAQVDSWIADVVDDLAGVDAFINNAGIAGPTANVEDISYDDWRRCLTVGLDSQFLTCRRLAPVMKQQRSGSIVNLSSVAGLVGFGQRSPYAAAKWAVIGFTKSLAIELGPYNVRVNAICPGSVAGDRMDRVMAAQSAATGASVAELTASYTEAQSIARFVRPDEIADMCAFLTSPAAAMVSGQAIAVDGHTETYHLT